MTATAMSAANCTKAAIDRLSGVLRVLELTRGSNDTADPDLLLMLEDVVACQIETLQSGVLPVLTRQAELARGPGDGQP